MGTHRELDADTVAIASVVDDQPATVGPVSQGRGARLRRLIRRAAVLVLSLFALLIVGTLINEVHYTRELLQAQIDADAQDARERGNLLDQVEEQNRRISVLSEQLEAAGLVPAGSLAAVDDSEPVPPATEADTGASTGGASSSPSAGSTATSSPSGTSPAAAPATTPAQPAPAPGPAPAPTPPATGTTPPCLLGLPSVGCVVGLPDLGLFTLAPLMLAPPVAADAPRARRARPWT